MKNILVTGASKGLGLSITKKLLDQGYKVYAVSRSCTTELSILISEYPTRLFYCSYDLTNVEDIKIELFRNFISLDVPLHGYVNNAALAYDDIVTNLAIPKIERMFRVNFVAPTIITKYSIRNMLMNNIKGSIVHISSISAHTGYKGLSVYAASKGALESFSKNVAREWGIKKIRSNALVVGFMETAMSESLTLSQKDRIYKRTSLKIPTDVESVASTTCFLLSEDAKSITGQNIFIDSGFPMDSTNTVNKQFYNTISEAWPFMLGNNFHWGYFESASNSLETATYNLIDQMLKHIDLNQNSSIIDIGCGIGEPANYIVNKHNCKVLGISNSVNGINQAKSKFSNAKLSFEVRDALSTELPDDEFDVAWLLEMSHLIKNKENLVRESCRLLKNNGRIVLCDLILLNPLSGREIFEMSSELRTLESSFGKASLFTLTQYEDLFNSLGLKEIKKIDVSEQIFPTINGWKVNAQKNKQKITSLLGEFHFTNFQTSCNNLEDLYRNGRWGYGIISAKK